jgi:hypothetical protein
MDPKRAQDDLIIQAVELFAPLKRAFENPSSLTDTDLRRLRAQFFHDRDIYYQKVAEFLREGEPGCQFIVESRTIQNLLWRLESWWQGDSPKTFTAWLELVLDTRKDVLDVLASVPILPSSVVGDGQTRFAVYSELKSLCTTVATRLIWQDRYFDSTVFHRYFSDTPEHVQIVLITYPLSKFTSKRDQLRYAAFIDASEMFAQDRRSKYRLCVTDGFHARRMSCDEQPYALDDSAQATAGSMSIHPITGPDKVVAVKDLEDRIGAATELYGTVVTTHPTASWNLLPTGKLELTVV